MNDRSTRPATLAQCERVAPSTGRRCRLDAVPGAAVCTNHHPDVMAFQAWLGLGRDVRGLRFDEPDLRLTAFEADRARLVR